MKHTRKNKVRRLGPVGASVLKKTGQRWRAEKEGHRCPGAPGRDKLCPACYDAIERRKFRQGTLADGW